MHIVQHIANKNIRESHKLIAEKNYDYTKKMKQILPETKKKDKKV